MTLTQEVLLSISDLVLQNVLNTFIELKNFQRGLLGRKMKIARGDILPQTDKFSLSKTGIHTNSKETMIGLVKKQEDSGKRIKNKDYD